MIRSRFPHEYWNRYRDADIDMPRVRIPVKELDAHSRRLRHVVGLDLQEVTDAQVRAARHAYYGAVSYVDDHIGSLVTALQRNRLRRRHGDRRARRSWRNARRARPVVQDELLRAGLPDTPAHSCAAPVRAARSRAVGVADRSAADARGARRATAKPRRQQRNWMVAACYRTCRGAAVTTKSSGNTWPKVPLLPS